VAPIASCPSSRLASKDAGAGEARNGGVTDTKLSKSELATSAFGGLVLTNERAADPCHLYLSAPLCLLSQTAKGVMQAKVFITKNGCFGMGPKHNSQFILTFFKEDYYV
jgi:hypothetical protein